MPLLDTVDALVAPLAGEEPAGVDPRNTEEFEAIGNELSKIGGVDLVPVDWGVVAKNSAHLLTESGKDLRCAVYVLVSHLYLEGPEALPAGISLLNRLLEDFGEGLHPRRPRARKSIFAWFAERLDLQLEAGSLTITGDEKGELVAALDNTANLVSKLELDPSSVRRVQTLVIERAGVKLSDDEQRAEVLERFDPEFAELAVRMLEHDSLVDRTARGLRIHRWVLWDNVPTLEDGVLDTTIDHAVSEEMVGLFESQSWPDLLERAETAFSGSPFWLDLTFYVARAATHVFDRAATVGVIGVVRDLLARAPELVEATDAAGQPLASEATRLWIQESVFETQETRSDSNEVLPAEVRTLFDEGRLQDALAEASAWISHPEGRVRFSRSVTLAEAFGAANAANNAHIVFRGLHNHLRQMTVKEWDPPIFAACIRGFLASKRDAFGLGPEDEHLMDELSALDPASLLSILPP
ncbi:MAG: TssA family type VI secretion system protein [Nannocystales bacterium]